MRYMEHKNTSDNQNRSRNYENNGNTAAKIEDL